MKIFKLNAINSTNQYLKDYIKNNGLENWLIASAEYQNSGRGQMHNQWHSDKSKNLLFSILIEWDDFLIKDFFYLNCAISLGIHNVLTKYKITKKNVKWPNDIMAENKKIAGILIENTLLKEYIRYSIIGIGFNVNQEVFADDIPNATSLKNLLHKEIDRDILLREFIRSFQYYVTKLENKEYEELMAEYEKALFKKDTPHMFEDIDHNKFLGKITGVNSQGKLMVELTNEEIKEFAFKEIKFL